MRDNSRFSFKEYFLFLLPLFFVLHGYIENIEAMQFTEALGLWGEYLVVTVIIFGNAFLIFRSQRKAALFTFSIMFYHLFFGAIHDAMKNIFGNSFITKYGFILPLSLIGFIALFIYLRKTKRPLNQLATYLNVLLLLLILIDVPRLLKASSNKKPLAVLANATVCDSCDKPDIYLIIADEYADSSSLQQIFGFNNGAFQAGLRERGFHIINNSRSNYNFTGFAMASIFQMDYLKNMEGRNQSLADKNRCYQLINNSGLWSFFKQHGYEIKNHSAFNVANIPTEAPQNYILIGKDMIVSHTFLSRINKDLRYHLVVTFKIESEINHISYFINRCNQLLLSRLLEEPKQVSNKPKFVYTHLTMPHYPYYFKKDGEANPVEWLQEGEQIRKKEYIGYLQYSNTLFTETIDRILKGSKKPPIILFMGDHGFREFADGFEKNAPYYYMNMNAVYLPNKNYSGFPDSISSVNQFRVLLNTSFGQKLPLLKDSTILLHE
jgi:hypothetical protein